MSHQYFEPQEVKEGLQPERVALAWQRTLLALIVVVAAGLRYSFSIPGLSSISIFVSAFIFAVIIAALIVNRRRYVISRQKLLQQEFAPVPSAQMFLIVIALLSFGILCLSFVVFF